VSTDVTHGTRCNRPDRQAGVDRSKPCDLAQPTSIAVGDFNGDGRADFVVVNNAGDSLVVFLNASLPVDRIFVDGFE
jgi:hypothetical protein